MPRAEFVIIGLQKTKSHTRKDATLPMEDLLDSILDSLSSVKKPQKKTMIIIVTTLAYFQGRAKLAYFQGRANFRNLSRFCSLCEETLGRWSLRSFSYQEFNRILLQRTQNLDSDWIASIDASFLPKSGKATEGLSYFYSGSQSKVQKRKNVTFKRH